MTLEAVEKEIARLQQSELVKLSQREQRIKQDKRRKLLADLRWHEKRGKELAAAGVTQDNIQAFVAAAEADQ
jgi:hypothetical protein